MDHGRLLLTALAGLANTADGRQLLMAILKGEQPFSQIAELAGNVNGMREVVAGLETFIGCLNKNGTAEVIGRLEGAPGEQNAAVLVMLRRIDGVTHRQEAALLAIPAYRKARQNQWEDELFTELAPNFEGQDQTVLAVAREVAKEIIAGKSRPTPDQLIARVQAVIDQKKE